MQSKVSLLRENVSRVVIGKEGALDLFLVGLIASGHILVEDVPGVGKALMARAIAASMMALFLSSTWGSVMREWAARFSNLISARACILFACRSCVRSRRVPRNA